MPPVVVLEVDDVVLEVDHALRPREVPCAAHDRVMAATVDLLSDCVVHVLRRISGKWADFCRPVGEDDFECR